MNFKIYQKKIISAFYKKFNFGQLYNRFKYEINASNRKEFCSNDPIWIQLYVTSRCNFRCNFCTNHSSLIGGKVDIGYHDLYKDMTYSMFKTVVERFKKATSCTFCGVGEPFLNKDLIEMIKYAKEKRMVTEVVTNGSMLNRLLINEILEIGLDRINISINESDKKRHQLITNTKVSIFDEIIKNVSYLVENKKANNSNLEIKISRVLGKSTLSYAEDFIKLGIKMGIDKIIFHNFILSADSEFGKNEYLFENDENLNFIENLKNKYRKIINIDFPILIKNNFSNKCPWYWKNISVDSNGNVSGCGRFITPRNDYGNIESDVLWNNKHFSEMRNKFIDNKMLECCKSCIENSSDQP